MLKLEVVEREVDGNRDSSTSGGVAPVMAGDGQYEQQRLAAQQEYDPPGRAKWWLEERAWGSRASAETSYICIEPSVMVVA